METIEIIVSSAPQTVQIITSPAPVNVTLDDVLNNGGGTQGTAATTDLWVVGGLNTAGGLTIFKDDTFAINSGISATNITANRSIDLPDESGTLAVKRYKSYVALLTQIGTNAPVATVLENDLGFTPIYSYQDPGNYWIEHTGGFPLNKVVVFITGNATNTAGYEYSASENFISIWTGDSSGSGADNLLNHTSIEIRIYP